MNVMKQIICPVSPERVDENVVRFTALWVVLLTALFILYPNPYIPAYLAIDFFVRAFTRSGYSPLSWFSSRLVKGFRMDGVQIDKAPKIFAARIGFTFSVAMAILALAGLQNAAVIAGAVLTLFAFLECGLNFCAGCWVYTYIVYPIVTRQ